MNSADVEQAALPVRCLDQVAFPELSASAQYSCWNGVGRSFSVGSCRLPDTLLPGEVLVSVDVATICGSDVKTVSGQRRVAEPSVLGHEQVGTVVATGVGASVAVGQRVVWSVTSSCGRCSRCSTMPQKCLSLRKYGHEPLDEFRPLTGGFASHCLLWPGTTIVPVPDSVPNEVASPAGCAWATAVAAVAAASPIRVGGRALVVGTGMLAIAVTALLAQRGIHVIVLSHDHERGRRLLRFGAAKVTDAAADIDVAFEMSGRATSVAVAAGSLAVGGTLVLAGSVSPGPAVAIDPEHIVRSLLTITGVHNYRPADLRTAVSFLTEHQDQYPFAELVAGRWRLTEMDEAFAAARTGGVRQCVVPSV
ncbi:alcohol dehydrogenase catalytic domain-containing protein [Actinoplanes sichuanensis]|uniref:alcohol dehydrogenase n=1 Tax=Actinoplanes sichuanensis TaxID=512349 RepID=A0ABW4A1U1_9ACTN|nr:alcohol dehydrogenase catalytic domain-containing protein [Actinoplanes sichuanensis]BEL12945.1 alcohol dehydrogenase catalytic domain-containing protein [Actinoplanes sichuanensis]